jgi:transposase
MANYREILRLHSLGISNKQVSAACHCSRTTVIDVLKRAGETSLEWGSAKDLSDKEITDRLFPPGLQKPCYKMPDYGEIHKEMGKNGVTLSLLWAEYCS